MPPPVQLCLGALGATQCASNQTSRSDMALGRQIWRPFGVRSGTRAMQAETRLKAAEGDQRRRGGLRRNTKRKTRPKQAKTRHERNEKEVGNYSVLRHNTVHTVCNLDIHSTKIRIFVQSINTLYLTMDEWQRASTQEHGGALRGPLANTPARPRQGTNLETQNGYILEFDCLVDSAAPMPTRGPLHSLQSVSTAFRLSRV